MKRGILLAAAVVAMGMFTVGASAPPQGRFQWDTQSPLMKTKTITILENLNYYKQ